MNLRTISWIIAAFVVYAASVAALLRSPVYSPEEAIFALIIFGIFFPGVAWLLTWRARRLDFSCTPGTREMIVVAAYVAVVFIYLVYGVSAIDSLVPAVMAASPKAQFILATVKKLLVFVVIPYLIFSRIFGATTNSCGV